MEFSFQWVAEIVFDHSLQWSNQMKAKKRYHKENSIRSLYDI